MGGIPSALKNQRLILVGHKETGEPIVKKLEDLGVCSDTQSMPSELGGTGYIDLLMLELRLLDGVDRGLMLADATPQLLTHTFGGERVAVV